MKKNDTIVLAISNTLIVVFVSAFLRGNNIISFLIIMAWAVYAVNNKMLIPKSLQRKRTKFEWGSSLILVVGFMLIYYHPNIVYVILTYIVFIMYNSILWVNMLRLRAMNQSIDKKNRSNRKQK